MQRLKILWMIGTSHRTQHELLKEKWPGHCPAISSQSTDLIAYEQPLVEPQVSHLRQVPLRTMVKLPHSEQLSPS